MDACAASGNDGAGNVINPGSLAFRPASGASGTGPRGPGGRPPYIVGMRRRLALPSAVAAAAFLACRAPAPVQQLPPAAEFLVAAGDTTFWVRSGPDGLHVRASPITIALVAGRFYELYTADRGVAYDDATFDWERLYRRDLLTGDSALVFEDASAVEQARRFAAARPGEPPLDDEDDAPADPSLAVAGEVDLLGVQGPYASVEHRLSRDTHAARGDGDAREARGTCTTSIRRFVIDLRTGREASLATLVGEAAAARAVDAGRRAFALAADSVRRGRGEAARLARGALASFTFDPASFTVEAVNGAPMVAFLVPGTGEHAGYALPLPPVPVTAPPWWAEARRALPAASPDSTSDLWAGARYRVLATYDPAGAVTVALRDTLGREWPVVRTQEPADRLYRLDTPPLGSDARRALARAFDDGALYEDAARAVRGPARVRTRRRPPAT